MHLGDRSEVSDDTKHLIDLKANDRQWSADRAVVSTPKADSSVKCAELQSIPGSQKVGKHPYKPNRPGKS